MVHYKVQQEKLRYMAKVNEVLNKSILKTVLKNKHQREAAGSSSNISAASPQPRRTNSMTQQSMITAKTQLIPEFRPNIRKDSGDCEINYETTIELEKISDYLDVRSDRSPISLNDAQRAMRRRIDHHDTHSELPDISHELYAVNQILLDKIGSRSVFTPGEERPSHDSIQGARTRIMSEQPFDYPITESLANQIQPHYIVGSQYLPRNNHTFQSGSHTAKLERTPIIMHEKQLLHLSLLN
jgi:hypothetical protein